MKRLGVDESGFILTEVFPEKIGPTFRPIVEHVLNLIIQEVDALLDGVYLYGSVATGRAVEGTSDLDIILVFLAPPELAVKKKIEHLGLCLSNQYEKQLRGVGLEMTDVTDVCSEKERFGGMCFLKHLCICIYGNDLTKDIPAFRPSADIAKAFNGDLGQSLPGWKKKIEEAASDGELEKVARSFAKKIVRAGFSLVMPRAGAWTSDLNTAAEMFIEYYPDQSRGINTALIWAKSGFRDRRAIVDFIDTFAIWLADEISTILS